MDDSEELPFPEWAAALVWLGAWCRKHQFSDKRLIAFAVLPSRELAAAFAGIGSLLAGARAFEDRLSWPKFRDLPPGSRVFWNPLDGRRHYQGKIIRFEKGGDFEFIVVQVLKAPRRAEIGYLRKISQRYFDDYQFTEEQPPTSTKASSFEDANQLIASLLGELSPQWIWADGAEGILVTSMVRFKQTITGVSLLTDAVLPVSLLDLLCIGKNSGQIHAKFRIAYPRGKLSGNFPLAILDGPEAFFVHEHLINTANVLTILDRSEYLEEINNSVLQLKSIANKNWTYYANDIPDRFPPGVEFAAYIIDR